jgi:biopolymer transport protein ExbB/TolQ
VERIGDIASQVWYLLQQGGWVMLILFLLGQVGWFLVVERWWTYRNEGRAAEASSVATELDRALSGAAGEGEPAMKKKAREILAPASHRLHRHLGTIAAISAAAPMLGLAGTVGGVMATFEVITIYGIGNPGMMAGGIAEALMVTEAALVIALPLMVLHDRLHARAERIEAGWTERATRLIRAAVPGANPVVSNEPDEGVGNHGYTVQV